MMKKIFLSAVFFIQGFVLPAQTGPGGVGTGANNVLWLKADAGTSSTINNTRIASWNDQSGNGLNVTQTVSVQQPSFVTNVMNGFPAIQFDNVSTANQNDKMLGPDSPLLDNTTGYTFFTVTRPQNLDGSARTIVCKRTTVSVDESFMLFYYTGNKLSVDIQTTDDRFFSNTAYANNTNYITSLVYNGALASNLRCTLYNEDLFDRNATETNTLIPDNNSPLLIGSTDASDPRPYGGYTSEIIIYREALHAAARIIVNNYLSAKYNIGLSGNDKYVGDNAFFGDHDLDVAGLGQEAAGSSPTFSASACAGFGLSVSAGLDNGDYIMAGHATPTNSINTSDVGGMTGTNNARWQRVWYVDVSNVLADMTVNVEFDMSDAGMGNVTPGPAANYVLLNRAGLSGNWTEIVTATAVSGDKILFSNLQATAANDGYYTLGTRNSTSSPLPITLLAFSAVKAGDQVNLAWSTATEKNNDHFTVERSQNGTDFESIAQVKGAGNSSTLQRYSAVDASPYNGIAYYRLKQTDRDGQFAYSAIVAVDFKTESDAFVIFPNPNNGAFKIRLSEPGIPQIAVTMTDLAGKTCFSGTLTPESEDGVYNFGPFAQGTYILTVSYNLRSYSSRVIIK